VALRMVRCDGRSMDLLFAATLERDPSGYPLRSLAVLRDVTAELGP